MTMSQRTCVRVGVALLSGCAALFAIYYLTTLLLVLACSPTPSTAVLVGGLGAQLVTCSLGAFVVGRAAWRRVGSAFNSTQQPTDRAITQPRDQATPRAARG